MNVKKELKDFIVDRFLDGNSSRLQDEDSLFEAGIIDSLGVLNLVSFLEKSFGVRVKDEELTPENFETVNSIHDFVNRKLEEVKGNHKR